MRAPYFADERSALYLGDCREVLAELDACSIDAVVTDPPYGLEFMGHDWDKLEDGLADRGMWKGRRGRGGSKIGDGSAPGGAPSGAIRAQRWHETWAREAYRVLKPGGHLLAFGAPRTFHRLTAALEDAGFDIRDCLMWLCGSGWPKHPTVLKPAWEPIVLARRPLDGTIAGNVAAHGTGALDVEAARIPGGERPLFVATSTRSWAQGRSPVGRSVTTDLGRWPANVVLDEVAAAMVDAQSEGASRFFYCAKSAPSERDAGLEGVRNSHPTVKPVALMRWLVRLAVPVGGSVLDPFTGSGTTRLAALAEGRRFVGVELNEEYLAIALARRVQAGLGMEGVI